MRKPLYSVFDSKTAIFCNPFTAVNNADAVRSFAYAANDEGNHISRNPSDFTLYYIAEMDTETAAIVSASPIQNLGQASQFKEGN